jgi:hypothetical protein
MGKSDASSGRLEMARPRILVVYYSRSGTTRKIAEAFSEALACDLEEIVEDKSRAGSFGYIRSLVEARQKRPSVIVPSPGTEGSNPALSTSESYKPDYPSGF